MRPENLLPVVVPANVTVSIHSGRMRPENPQPGSDCPRGLGFNPLRTHAPGESPCGDARTVWNSFQSTPDACARRIVSVLTLLTSRASFNPLRTHAPGESAYEWSYVFSDLFQSTPDACARRICGTARNERIKRCFNPLRTHAPGESAWPSTYLASNLRFNPLRTHAPGESRERSVHVVAW